MIVRYDPMNQEHRDFVIEVMSDESVLKGAGDDGTSEIDWPAFADQCLTFIAPGAGVVFGEVYADGETVEVHTNFLPSKRGKSCLDALREIAEHIFCTTPIQDILTYAQHDNKGAIGMCRLMGFREIYKDGAKSYKQLNIVDWLLNGSMNGQDFVEACTLMYSPYKAMSCYNRAARLVRAIPAVVDEEGVISVGEKVAFSPSIKEKV